MVTTFHVLALLLYLGAAVVFVGSLAGGRRGAPRAGGVVAAVAVVMHAIAIGAYTVVHGEMPLVGLAPSLSLLAFLIGCFLLVALMVREVRTLGLVLVPLIAALIGAGLILGMAPTGEPLAFRGPWFVLHVLLTMSGYAGLAVAFAAGLVYLLQRRELKGKHFGRVFRYFPSLETLDAVGRRALVIGFPALSLGLLVGWAWTVRFRHPLGLTDPKVLWGGLTWFIFVAAFGARASGVACNRRGAQVSVVGFVVVVLSYMVLRLLGSEGGSFL